MEKKGREHSGIVAAVVFIPALSRACSTAKNSADLLVKECNLSSDMGRVKLAGAAHFPEDRIKRSAAPHG